MPESNLPPGTADGGALSFDDGVSAIENLNIDSEAPNPDDKVEATNEAETEEPETDTPDEADAETDVDAEDPDDSPDEDLKGGRFAPDTAKVTLSDGTVTTVAELKRNNLFQADYTRKTTELKAEKNAFEQQKSEVGKIAQAIAQQRDFLLQAAPMFLPKAPDRELMQSDPFGYMQAKAEYDEKMQVVNQLMFQSKAERDRQAREQEEAENERRATEAARLMEAVPEFRDRKVYDQFWSDATTTMAEHYGFSAEELAELTDHRLYVAMRDLVKYRKALKQAPKVAQDIKGKPKLMQGSRRMDPKAKTSREAQIRSENLRKTGSFDAGVAALMDLDL
jgi:hypothetical protein